MRILHVVEAAEAAVADIQSVPPNAGTCPPGAGIGSELLDSLQGFPCCARVSFRVVQDVLT